MPFRFPLRITLLVTNLFVFCVTFTIIWLSATRGLEGSVYGMAQSLTRETMLRVKQEAAMPLHEAQVASQLVTRQVLDNEKVHGRPLTIRDSDELIFQLHDIMVALPRLSFLSCSFAARGEYLHVERRDRHLEAVKVVRLSSGEALHYTYFFEGHHLRLVRTRHHYIYDPRQRPYYKAAATARQPIWTDPYLFVNVQGVQYPGLSLATPIYSAAGQLRYVLTADFSCQAISEYLGQIHIGTSGYAYVVAQKADGTPELIAHPRPAVMLESRNGAINLVDAQHLTDPVLRSILPWAVKEAKQRNGNFALSSQVNNQQYFLGYEKLDAGHMGVGIVVPARELVGQLQEHQRNITLAGLTALGLGLVLSILISMAISRPLQSAVLQLSKAGRFELQTPKAPPSILIEVDDLGHGIEAMKLGLGSFARYVPADLVRRMLDSGTPPEIGGELCELTIHFCDIIGFSSLAEVLEPNQLFKLLSEMLSELSDEIAHSGGTVDKYIGDNIMAFWGAPEPLPDHARRAVRTALSNQARLEKLRAGWRARQLPEMHARIGLHTGMAMVGNIGSSQRLNYTTLGDAVNVASRLEGLNRLYGTGIIISDSTRHAVGPDLLARPLDWIGVAGREQPLMIYEPLGFVSDMSAEERARLGHLQALAEGALDAYRARDWANAALAFSAIIEMRGTDTAAELLLARCHILTESPPDAEWDGVSRASKDFDAQKLQDYRVRRGGEPLSGSLSPLT